MSSVNKVILVGRLGADPDRRQTSSGKSVTNFSLATGEYWQDENGQKQEKTQWHRIVLWNRLAELAEEYLKQGSLVYIEGSLQTRSWEDKEGISRNTTEVVGRSMQFLESKSSQNGENCKAGNLNNHSVPNHQSNGGFPFQPGSQRFELPPAVKQVEEDILF